MRINCFRGFAALIFVSLVTGLASGQPKGTQEADALLNTARKAYADANYPFAVEKFREFLTKFGSHKDANAARYGLGLALLDLPKPDYKKALDAFSPAFHDPTFADRALAYYHAGAARRGLGLLELAEAAIKPNERSQREQAANKQFAEAHRLFGEASKAFENKKDVVWDARVRCDSAEMELRLGKTKEARTTAEPFVKDARFAKSQYRPLGLYYHGFACFLLNDIPAAGKSLNQLSPFDQPFGPHARYLMGRIHSTQDEKAEAAAAFDAVTGRLRSEEEGRALRRSSNPISSRHDPWEKARLEALAKGPPPDYVAGAAFLRRVPELRGRASSARRCPSSRRSRKNTPHRRSRTMRSCGPGSASCRPSSSTRR